MTNWLRRLWGKNYVKLTRRIGEDEILEISFNEIDGDYSIARTHAWLDFLVARMKDHNEKVLAVADTVGGAVPKPHRIK